MTKTLLIIVGLICALVSAAGIMYHHPPVNQKTNLFPIVEDGKWGYINNTGKVVIEPQFNFAYGFADGMARVEIGDKYGYIDRNGKMAITPQFDVCNASTNFSEGLAAVRVKVPTDDSYSYDKWGYINKKGTMVIKPQFYSAGPFRNGMALVELADKNGRSSGNNKYIDKTGRVIGDINKKIGHPDEFFEGMILIQQDGEVYYTDKAGKITVRNPKLKSNEELTYTDTEEGPGFIDRTGKVVISNPSFQCGFPFSEGLAAIRVHENFKFGYIDKTGKFVIPPQFEYAYSFANGIAKVEIGSWMKKEYQFGYIDKTGKFIWGPSAIPPDVMGTPEIPGTPNK